MAVTGFLAGTFLISVGTLIVYLLGGIEWINISFPAGDLFLGLLLMALLASAEEFIFRGLILRRMARATNKWTALFISAALFAVVHLANTDITPLGIINVFQGGLVFGIYFLLSRSLLHVICLHFAWNFWQGPVFGFPVSGLPFDSILMQEASGSKLISGAQFGFEGSIVCTVILLLAFTGGLWLYLQRPRKRSAAAGSPAS